MGWRPSKDFCFILRRILLRFLDFADREVGGVCARRFESVRLGDVYRVGSSRFRFLCV